MATDLNALLQTLANTLVSRQWTLCSAESCTGGLIAAACTELSGSSQWFDRGFVTYSNAAKTDMLGLPAAWIEQQGAVSEAVARAMVEGAVQRSGCDAAIAVTGIAGPTGGSPDKPVGTVWVAWHAKGVTTACKYMFSGDRQQVRHSTVTTALQGMLERLT
jgi:nicotinamide-nucleotide amidase